METKQIDAADWDKAIELLRAAQAALDQARNFINSKPEMAGNHQLQRYLAIGGTIGRR